ncbi:MAG TPA: AAA family ATPase [Candidatus Thermoplasmatota archaeon]|nr:AAA family ATPase [Candidatus Thermoplasmatota archaeon]
MRDIIAGELGGPTVFRDRNALTYEYLPERLPRREEDMAKLSRIYRGLLQGGGAAHVLVMGDVGTGKTALARRFSEDFKAVAKERGVNIEYTHVNCRRRSTEGAALLQILTHFDPRFPDRGFSNTEMLENLRKRLERLEAHLIVILDEVDVLLKKSGSDLVYHLTRFNEEASRARYSVSLVMVSQMDARTLLDEAAQSTFGRTNVLHLEKYEKSDFAQIVPYRVELAFNKGAFPLDAQDAAIDAASAQDVGGARYAVDLLRKAGQNAEDAGRSKVAPEDVRTAAATELLSDEKLEDLDRHKQLTLLAIARVLKKGGAFATTGEAEEAYALACEEFQEKPRAHTQFWTFLKELDSQGLVRTRRSGKGIVGTTTLISLPDTPAHVLEEKLLKLLRRVA